jgi:hypothetical protein
MSANSRSLSLFRTTAYYLLTVIFVAGFILMDLQPGLAAAYPENAVECAAFFPDPQDGIGAVGGPVMEHDHSRFSTPDPNSWRQEFKTLRFDPELTALEEILRQINIWEHPEVQKIFRRAKFGTPDGITRARVQLREIVEVYRILEVRQTDPFMPYATKEQISRHHQGVHILDQAYNQISLYAAEKSFPLGWLILGPQGGGKSSAAFHIFRQLRCPILFLDPKGTWEFRADALDCEVIPSEFLQFDLHWPNETELPRYLHTQLEGIANATGLQYGVSPLTDALDIAFAQRKTYIEQTGVQTPLCLQDIRLALDLCDKRNPKRAQYVESVRAALDLLLGKNALFGVREGIPLKDLFAGRYILSTRFLTTVQSRYLGWYLLNYVYYQSLHQPETTQLRNLIVMDDASKQLSKPDSVFGEGTRTSPWMHLLSTLRSTGTGVILIDQLVEPIYDDIKQLCGNWIVIGGMRNTRNQADIASAMGLTSEQADMLGRMQPREAVVFCPTTYPRAVHGHIPIVAEPCGKSVINRGHLIYEHLKQWTPLTELPPSCLEKDAATGGTPSAPAASRPPESTPMPGDLVGMETALAKTLWNIICNPYHNVTQQIKQLDISVREFENQKHQLRDQGYILESSAGNNTFLIPTVKAYQAFKMPSPFGLEPEHPFYVALGVSCLKKDPTVRHVFPEHPIGTGDKRSDIAVVAHDGRQTAYEVTLNTSNILSNATKYNNTAFARIVFLSRDFKLREAVRACCREGGLDPKLLSRIDFQHISEFLRQQHRLARD